MTDGFRLFSASPRTVDIGPLKACLWVSPGGTPRIRKVRKAVLA